MNVWLWGPPMWDTLHKAAYICDVKNISSKPMFETLKVLLPCKYCRNSYVTFYEDLGPPVVGQSSAWIHNVHTMVNNKLAVQRMQSYLETTKFPSHIQAELIANVNRFAYTEPSLEIVQKRTMLYSENLFQIDYILVFLIAIASNVQKSSTKKDTDTRALLTLIQAIAKFALESKQSHIAEVLLGIRPKNILEDLEYIKDGKYNISKLMQAKACAKGSCT